jgi:hypothetical protein
MDWRHMAELSAAGMQVFDELKNVCIWNKKNAGMGTFYRSKYEMVFVFKKGTAPHVNTFGLGESGRHRANVWDYAGVSALSKTGLEELAMHPTVKPVAMIVDALKDCSARGDIVLDNFGGSGSTLIAAEKCGRRARLIEFDAGYCDVIIKRWQAYTGKRRLCRKAATATTRLPANDFESRSSAIAPRQAVRIPTRPSHPPKVQRLDWWKACGRTAGQPPENPSTTGKISPIAAPHRSRLRIPPAPEDRQIAT